MALRMKDAPHHSGRRRRFVPEALRMRLTLAALAGAVAPLMCLAAVLINYDAPAAEALALAGLGFFGAVAGASLARLPARPLERLAARLDARIWGSEGPPAGAPLDPVQRLTHGVDLLLTRLDERRAIDRPARLDDPLTGLSNRIDLMRRGRDEIARARRAGTPLAFAMIEIEQFRAYADEVGPVASEVALRRCAELLAPSLRAYDAVGRWEEAVFAVILPESEIEYAAAAMRRVRDAVIAARAVTRDGAALSVICGVAVLHPQDATIADIAPRAARALARARAGYGDGVECAPGPRSKPAQIAPV